MRLSPVSARPPASPLSAVAAARALVVAVPPAPAGPASPVPPVAPVAPVTLTEGAPLAAVLRDAIARGAASADGANAADAAKRDAAAAIALLAAAMDAVGDLHGEGIVHRALHPGLLLVSPDGAVTVTGLAHAFDAMRPLAEAPTLDPEGAAWAFAAPELRADGGHGGRSPTVDVHALAAILREALGADGRADSPAATHAGPALEAALLLAVAADPAARPGDARALAEVVRRAARVDRDEAREPDAAAGDDDLRWPDARLRGALPAAFPRADRRTVPLRWIVGAALALAGAMRFLS